jgi:hypothetical protein
MKTIEKSVGSGLKSFASAKNLTHILFYQQGDRIENFVSERVIENGRKFSDFNLFHTIYCTYGIS